MLESTNVLCILPNLTIGDQVNSELSHIYSSQHSVGRTGNMKVRIEKYTSRGLVLNSDALPDVVTTNVQALVDTSRAKAGEAGEEGAKEPSLNRNAETFINTLKPDLVIIDEGHHFPASSWELLSESATAANTDCKFLLLTATPQRGDGRQYGLKNVPPPNQFFYLYSRKDAIKNKFIKEIHYQPIPASWPERIAKKVERYEDPDYIVQIVDPAVKMLLGLRTSCGGAPLRMLINARTNDSAGNLATILNERSRKEGWGLHFAAITGKTKDNSTTKINFSCRRGEEKDGPMVDVAIQNQMLGEGYDNDFISISVFVRPAKSVGILSQTHGRAIRRCSDLNPGGVLNLNGFDYPRANESYLFYPNEDDVQEVVDQYKNFADESIASL